MPSSVDLRRVPRQGLQTRESCSVRTDENESGAYEIQGSKAEANETRHTRSETLQSRSTISGHFAESGHVVRSTCSSARGDSSLVVSRTMIKNVPVKLPVAKLSPPGTKEEIIPIPSPELLAGRQQKSVKQPVSPKSSPLKVPKKTMMKSNAIKKPLQGKQKTSSPAKGLS